MAGSNLLSPYGLMGRLTPPAFYQRLATNTLTERGLYLNLGYWATATTIDEASEALAELVASAAAMGPEDEVVDVGFGFADQDIFWMRRFGPRRITGLNVTPVQIRIARRRIRMLGLADRVDLRYGSATAMELPDASCDVVTAVECAFHFDTRAAFFKEAFRILRPGGRLVLADIIRADTTSGLNGRLQDLAWSGFAQVFAVPADNAVGRRRYEETLHTTGFEGVKVDSISDQVFPGWHKALGDDRALRRRIIRVAPLPYRLFSKLDARLIYGALDYVLAVARKPL